MKKYLYVALVALASAAMFVACASKNKPSDGNTYAGDTWITSPEMIDAKLVNDSIYSCWELQVWCDGTTIGVEPFWGTEAQLIYLINMSMEQDKKVFGEYHKKFRYYLVEENTEQACMARQWEGAECWLETVTFTDKNGAKQTSEEYVWLPEANMKERHDYYMAHLEQIGVASHEYKHVDARDQDACFALNPEDSTIIPPVDPKDYSRFDSLTYKCWKVTQDAYGMTVTHYVWMTERQMVEYFDMMKLNYVYEEADAHDEDSCKELEEESEPVVGEEACWKITSTVMGQTSTEYYWGPEAGAQAIVNGINSTGMGTASYTKAAATDPDSCH